MNILGAGDIKNIIQVLKVAMEVQIDRLVNAKDQNEYANAYTIESVDMMGDILERSESWFGIPKGSLQWFNSFEKYLLCWFSCISMYFHIFNLEF